MEKLDKTLSELTNGLIIATLFLGLIALLMIRFGFTHPDNDIWKCLLFALKGCACGWFYLWGRYSVKELLRANLVNCELKVQHSEDRFHDHKVLWEEQLSNSKLKIKSVMNELESAKLREEAFAQKLKAYTRTPADANQKALKGFL